MDELQLEDVVRASSSPNTCIYTITVDEQPAAFMGLNMRWAGVAETWSVTSALVKKVPLGFHKAVKRLMIDHVKALGLHRIHCTVRADYPDGARWLESLKFKEEGMMHQYGPNKMDYVMYARVFE